MMERSEYQPKPENVPREKPAMAEELATLRELVANLRGQLEEAVRERGQARDQLAALRAKFEADRDTALDAEQAVSCQVVPPARAPLPPRHRMPGRFLAVPPRVLCLNAAVDSLSSPTWTWVVLTWWHASLLLPRLIHPVAERH